MNNQQMQFEDSNRQKIEQDTYKATPINTDPREQPRSEAPVSEGYAGPGYRGTSEGYAAPQEDPITARQMYGAKLQPDQQPRRRGRRRRWWRPLVAVIVILALLAALTSPITGAFGVRIGWSTSTLPAHTYQVSGLANVTINDNIGDIHVHTGSGNTVQITATVEHGPLTGVPTVNWGSSNQGPINVSVSEGSGINFLSTSTVDFDVTLPSSANLDLHTNLGSIDVDGATGQANLSTNAGSITMTNSHLSGNGTLSTNAGSVNFSGDLDPSASYTMRTNAGSVNVTLPASSSFHVDATTNAGSINSTFPVTIQGNGAGKEVHADVGSDPRAQLNLSTNAGEINVNQKP